MADISNFVIDARIDAWFGHAVWRTVTHSPEWIEDLRARMRRVLDAHDAARSHVATDVMLEGARAAWNTGANVDRWLSLSDLKIIVDGALAPSPWDPVKSPGHTDLMISPESIYAFLEANPPPEPDPNTLPMDALPEGWMLHVLEHSVVSCRAMKYRVLLRNSNLNWHLMMKSGTGPTPRAAFLAAIEAAKEGK